MHITPHFLEARLISLVPTDEETEVKREMLGMPEVRRVMGTPSSWGGPAGLVPSNLCHTGKTSEEDEVNRPLCRDCEGRPQRWRMGWGLPRAPSSQQALLITDSPRIQPQGVEPSFLCSWRSPPARSNLHEFEGSMPSIHRM